MKITLSILKADVGSIGGHTKPSKKMMDATREAVQAAIDSKLIIDGFVSHTGDDIAMLVSHTRGADNDDIHQFAWRTFLEGTAIAQKYGLYGAGQDLLVDAPSGNIRGAGPAVAEVEFDHDPVRTNRVRPAESFLMFAADKCGPGAYNLPFFLGFADPMYCAGLMLPRMIGGFKFRIIDMDHTEGDSIIELNAPEDSYKIAMLLRDNERFGIDGIYSRTYDERAVSRFCAASPQHCRRLHRQGTTRWRWCVPREFSPRREELVSPFTKAHYIGGDARGSHVMPLMPVPLNTSVTGVYCLPLVTCAGFSLDADGYFSDEIIDIFDNPAWDYVRTKAQEKALAMRDQGWSGAAMLPYNELEYSGFRDTVEGLLSQFAVQEAT